MAGRWDALPSSEQEQHHLASTTTTTQATTTLDPLFLLRQRVGGFIREEPIDSGRSVCYYRHLDTDQPLPFLCDFGCCSTGCCTAAERAEFNPYSWALALLAVLLITILIAMVGLSMVYWVNKKQTNKMRKEMVESSRATESSNVSQISGPGSYFYPEGFYSYGTKAPLPY